MTTFHNLLWLTLVAAMLRHASSYSYQQQVNYYLPSNFDQTHLTRKSPRPPTYPPRDFEENELLFLEETHRLVNELKHTPPPLPMTNNPYALLGLDWLNPPSDITTVHKAYKRMAKRYHPDLILHADATPEEQHLANKNFARINAAYEQLKAKESKEILDYIVYVDGRKVRRHVTIKSESYYKDPMRPNYERIIAMSKYREKYPRKKLWFERKHSYEPRHNGEWEP
ncbi:hypothetical protein ACHAWO_005323 [Cyclotella atomus]|uniref:J domain-containing protein n=1 Tax=Cyclotella atomus TaxID=382360 RepID=A0ABD3QXS2_9STRA